MPNFSPWRPQKGSKFCFFAALLFYVVAFPITEKQGKYILKNFWCIFSQNLPSTFNFNFVLSIINIVKTCRVKPFHLQIQNLLHHNPQKWGFSQCSAIFHICIIFRGCPHFLEVGLQLFWLTQDSRLSPLFNFEVFYFHGWHRFWVCLFILAIFIGQRAYTPKKGVEICQKSSHLIWY